MKNTENYKVIKTIFMSYEQFEVLIENVTDGLMKPLYETDGISYDPTDKAEETETYWNKDINETLSKYFGVNVTSIHADDSVHIGIWIAFKED